MLQPNGGRKGEGMKKEERKKERARYIDGFFYGYSIQGLLPTSLKIKAVSYMKKLF